MNRKRWRIFLGGAVTVQAVWLLSCGGHRPGTTVLRKADSLNAVSYELRYKDLNASLQAAQAAYSLADGHPLAMAEALNNRAFYAFMRMDFEGATRLYTRAAQLSPSEIERLVADVGLMKICQRTSMNKEFYDYRNSALRRMKRIREDEALVTDPHDRQRFHYATSEFYIVTGVYYYYLQQHEASMEAIRSVTTDLLAADTAQWLYYEYMTGSGEMYEAPTPEEVVEGEFLHLTNCLFTARAKGYPYFEANALQAMSEMLVDAGKRDILEQRHPELLRMVNAEGLPLDTLPLFLARRSLKLFQRYGDWYQISGAYRTLATCYNATGHPHQALPYLTEALQYVNYHHERYYYCKDSTDRLQVFDTIQTVSPELKWIESEGIHTVPEWILRLREQLSLTYSALGLKPQSDYNRNIYLDLLDYTRQDKELESRYAILDNERRQLNVVLALVVAGFLLLVALSVIFSRRWRWRNRQYLATLRRVLDLCRSITAVVPPQAADKDEVAAAVASILQPELMLLLPTDGVRIVCDDEAASSSADTSMTIASDGCQAWPLLAPGKSQPVGTLFLQMSAPLRKEDAALLALILPYLAWTLENGLNLVALDGERCRLEREQFIHERHLADNKCQNAVRKACLSIVTGILPYMDRVISEMEKLRSQTYAAKPEVRHGKYVYIGELIGKINEYNDILARWIQMRRGTVSLNIENFALEDLFQVIAKGRRSFEMKRQTLEVVPTKAVVKADKALTLFMINTLADNARKYTPEGGMVRLEAVETATYVEIAVTDNGPGLSAEDQHRLLEEKVCHSASIGWDTAADTDELRRQKGHGFGLMNCKGIIEKYRKTNGLFSVCALLIDSTPGQGSRFSFRLPKGVLRSLLVLLLVALGGGQTACTSRSPLSVVPEQERADTLLAKADDCANRVYYHNVEGRYTEALQAADSACWYLNRYYQLYSSRQEPLLVLNGSTERPAEQQWLDEGFDTDYYILLDVRNEVAVAALALHDFSLYSYNNAAYAALYRQISRDRSLQAYCEQVQRSSNGKLVGLGIFGLLAFFGLLGYYLLYFRHRLHYRYNMEQLFVVYRAIIAAATSVADTDEEEVPRRLVNGLYAELNELLPLSGLALAVYDEESHSFHHAARCNGKESVEELAAQLHVHFSAPTAVWNEWGSWSYLPLWVETAGERHCTGVLALQMVRQAPREEDLLLVELAAGYLAVVLYNTVVCVRRKHGDIELAQDEARRLMFEENLLHVQNQVLDNCLSTIKHETIYYPNRIRQMIERLEADSPLSEADEQERLQNMSELMDYYKDIFTLLTRCAARQLDEVTFRRGEVEVDELLQEAAGYLHKAGARLPFVLDCEVVAHPGIRVVGDRILLRFLFRQLMDEALRDACPGTLRLSAREEGSFVRLELADNRRTLPQEELDQLFYPDSRRIYLDASQRLCGIGYLVCKQILRDHDEYAGRRGCRINATALEGGGYTVWFTLPLKSN